MNKTTKVSSQGEDKGVGFFQLNFAEFKKAAFFGHEAAIAYIVLCGGVDTKKSDKFRTSTHGYPSVEKRTTMSQSRAERAIKSLLENKLIKQHESREINKTHVLGMPTYYINDDQVSSDVAISQEFLSLSKRIENKKDHSYPPQSLAYIYDNFAQGDDIPRNNAMVDALALFFALHQKQDFDLYGGVNPKISSAEFRRIQEGEGWDAAGPVIPMQGNPNWKFFSMTQKSDFGFDEEFLAQTFEGLPTWDGCPSHNQRGLHALKQLQKASLIYNAIVLWEENPLIIVNSTPIDPIYTLYVGTKRDWKNELMLQNAIHDAMLTSDTLPREIAFPFSREGKTKPIWTNSDVYTYALDDDNKSGKETLLLQLRVARWPAEGKIFKSLKADQIRIEKWKNRLESAARSVQADC